MPKLLKSRETGACEATIELDNRDVVFLSIARAGVLVRLLELKSSIINGLLGNWLGVTLYDEKELSRHEQTARALSTIFSDQASAVMFNNHELAVFANAIWHCATAAEVSVVLNEATLIIPSAARLP
jgi:hypothetical protein